MLCCLQIGVGFNSFFPSELKSEYIDTPCYSLCDFWSLSNKYIHCEVPIQLFEIHLHSTVSVEPLKSVSNVNLRFLRQILHTVLTKAAVYACLNCA